MLPEIILAVMGCLLLIIALFTDNRQNRLGAAVPVVAVLSLTAALIAIVWLGTYITENNLSNAGLNVDTGGHLRVDMLSLFFKGVIVAATLLVSLMSVEYARRFDSPGEFFGLLVLTTLAASLLSSAADLITIYLSMEFLSITSYAMAGYYRENPRSNEASLKYFLYGAMTSALMLYGMSLLYGLSANDGPASTLLTDVIRGIASQPLDPLIVMAMVCVLAGFFFKVSAVPFHQWAPDTYQGAPTPFTAFLSVASKLAGLAVLCRVVATLLLVPNYGAEIANTLGATTTAIIALVAALSMFVGNLIAIQQRDLKRLLAYSGIAQIGYLLVGVAAMVNGNHDNAFQAVVIYMITYLFMNLGAFGVVIAINNRFHSSDVDAFSGLSRRSPWLAASMAIFLLGLAGVPPAAGWFGKYYLFVAAIHPSLDGALVWLAVVLVINSVIAAYYYLGIIQAMYFSAPESETPVTVHSGLRAGILASMVATLVLGTVGIWPMYQLVQQNMSFQADPPTAPDVSMTTPEP